MVLHIEKEFYRLEAIEFFSIIGTISFALQGAIIAMEKRYDLFAVYIFGITTAFGGGALRATLLGESGNELWHQDFPFIVAIISVTIALIFPHHLLEHKRIWGDILDAVGIISFAIQGSMIAVEMNLPYGAAIVAALLTATGGGLFRDIVSKRQSILLDENVYGLWIFLVGLIIGKGWASTNTEILLVFFVFTTLRILSYKYDWKVPYRPI